MALNLAGCCKLMAHHCTSMTVSHRDEVSHKDKLEYGKYSLKVYTSRMVIIMEFQSICIVWVEDP
jgi:hypothetical protein